MRRFTRNPVCGTKFATSGPIHARIGPFAFCRSAFGPLISDPYRCSWVADQPSRSDRDPLVSEASAGPSSAASMGSGRGPRRGRPIASADSVGSAWLWRSRVMSDLSVAKHVGHALRLVAGGQLHSGESCGADSENGLPAVPRYRRISRVNPAIFALTVPPEALAISAALSLGSPSSSISLDRRSSAPSPNLGLTRSR